MSIVRSNGAKVPDRRWLLSASDRSQAGSPRFDPDRADRSNFVSLVGPPAPSGSAARSETVVDKSRRPSPQLRIDSMIGLHEIAKSGSRTPERCRQAWIVRDELCDLASDGQPCGECVGQRATGNVDGSDLPRKTSCFAIQ
jgi:hypothetical protein